MKPMLFAASLLLAVHSATALAQTPDPEPKPYTSYSAVLTITAPSGSAGASLKKTQPTGTKFSPCSSAESLDQLTLTIKYDAGKIAENKRNLYVFFYRAEAEGKKIDPASEGVENDPPFFSVTKRRSGTPYLITERYSISDLNANRDVDAYVPAADNLGGAITETVLGGNSVLEGLASGTWQAIAIVADGATVDFDDPETWLAWDVATFVLRKPWQGTSNQSCQ